MLRPEATLHLTGTAPGEAPVAPTVEIGQRYRLGRVVGTGGSGSVVQAHDRLTGEQVAVKLMRALTAAELARVRREVTALRRVRLPGCVRLRDDGVQDDAYYVVMDLVHGTPFPGGPLPMAWADLATRVAALVHVLSRVHARGLAHLDLKPGNVLVGDGPADVWLLDFGIASGPAVSASPEAEVRYTPRYAAPERIAGRPGDARTDLWGVSAMVLESVTGLQVHGVEAPLAALTAAGVPADAARVLAAMLAEAPEDRPGMGEVLRVLAPHAAEPLRDVALPTASVGETALWALFEGPDAFLHLREDGATALFRRSRGEPAAVRQVLGEWLAGGLAEVRDGLVVMDRPTLDGLLAPEVRTVEGIDDLLDRGETTRAAAVIEQSLAWAREGGEREVEAALLHRLARSAVAPAAPAYALDAVLYEIGRSELDSRAVRATEALIRCEIAVRRKQVEVARGLLSAVIADVDPSLASWAWYQRARIARLEGPEAVERELEALGSLASRHPERRMQLIVVLAGQAYLDGSYAESANLYQEAETLAQRVADKVLCWFGAAASLLEIPDRGRARALATKAHALATMARNPSWELRATWLLRTAQYRAGAPIEPDVDLVRIADRVGNEASALLALNEAAIAWRAGDLGLATSLASVAEARGVALSRVTSTMLGASLRIACAGPAGGGDLRSAADLVAECTVPELQAQGWGLLHRGTGDDRYLTFAHEQARRCHPSRWGTRLDVLSLDEAVDPAPLHRHPPPPEGGALDDPGV